MAKTTKKSSSKKKAPKKTATKPKAEAPVEASVVEEEKEEAPPVEEKPEAPAVSGESKELVAPEASVVAPSVVNSTPPPVETPAVEAAPEPDPEPEEERALVYKGPLHRNARQVKGIMLNGKFLPVESFVRKYAFPADWNLKGETDMGAWQDNTHKKISTDIAFLDSPGFAWVYEPQIYTSRVQECVFVEVTYITLPAGVTQADLDAAWSAH